MPRTDPSKPPFESEELEPVAFLKKGAWGSVWRYRQFSRVAAEAAHHTRTAIGYVAVKCVEAGEYTRLTIQHAFAEARAQRRGAGNPHVVALYDAVVVKDNLIALIMEEVEGGRTLSDEIKEAHRAHRQFPADLIARWTKEIALGLQAFHVPARRDGKKVAHHDICPDNVLLTRDRMVKLADMGIATVVGETGAGTNQAPALGRTLRMAPEQYYGDDESGIGVDYWALGLIVFELVMHRPLEHFCLEQVPEMTQSPEYSRAIGEAVRRQVRRHPSVHPELRDLIGDLLVDDPRHRGGLARVEEAEARISGGRRVPAGRRPAPEPRDRGPVGSSGPTWMAPEELAGLRAAFEAAPSTAGSNDGAFERLVGERRARRHRQERDR